MANLLQQWARAGVTKKDVASWAVVRDFMQQRKAYSAPPMLSAVLRRYGLGSLEQWAAEAIHQGKSQEQVLIEMRERPEFIQRFPAIDARERNNLPPISVEDYLAYEETASSLASMWGLSLSKREVDDLLTNDVSAVELEQRFDIAAQVVFESPQETRDALARLYDVNLGDMMRYWMNPKEELGHLQQRFRASSIAGAAARVGYGEIGRTEAHRLMEVGVDPESAAEGFTTLRRMRPLFTPMRMREDEIDTQTQLDFLAGDVEAARTIERRARERIAEFEGSSGFTAGQEGFTTGVAT